MAKNIELSLSQKTRKHLKKQSLLLAKEFLGDKATEKEVLKFAKKNLMEFIFDDFPD